MSKIKTQTNDNATTKPLNLVKLCVGISAVEELQAAIDFKLDQRQSSGRPIEQIHTTRMTPKRSDELLSGGSLYWVIKGKIQVRQVLLDIRPFVDGQGIKRCDLVLEPRLIETQFQPRRAFQGWRYLKLEDCPPDMGKGTDENTLPNFIKSELDELGLL